MWYFFAGIAGLILYSVLKKRRTADIDYVDEVISEVRPLNPKLVSRYTQTDPESPMKLILRDEPNYYFDELMKH